jgi:hypothetical protein
MHYIRLKLVCKHSIRSHNLNVIVDYKIRRYCLDSRIAAQPEGSL